LAISARTGLARMSIGTRSESVELTLESSYALPEGTVEVVYSL
jgi:hypothetical protein